MIYIILIPLSLILIVLLWIRKHLYTNNQLVARNTKRMVDLIEAQHKNNQDIANLIGLLQKVINAVKKQDKDA